MEKTDMVRPSTIPSAWDITVVCVDRTDGSVEFRVVWEYEGDPWQYIASVVHELVQSKGHADLLIRWFFN